MRKALPWAGAAVALLSLPAYAAATFTGTNAVGKAQLPDEVTFVTDAAVAFEVTAVTLPSNGPLKVSIRCDEAYVFSYDQSLTDGTSTLDATYPPVDADTWFDHDVGNGVSSNSTISDIYIATSTTSTRCWAVAMGAAEPGRR